MSDLHETPPIQEVKPEASSEKLSPGGRSALQGDTGMDHGPAIQEADPRVAASPELAPPTPETTREPPRIGINDTPNTYPTERTGEASSGRAKESPAVSADGAAQMSGFYQPQGEPQEVKAGIQPGDTPQASRPEKGRQEVRRPGQASDQNTSSPFEVPQHREVVNGKEQIVYGDPAGDMAFNHLQGENDLKFKSDCGLVACQDVLNQHGIPVTENDIVNYADANNLWGNQMKEISPAECGGTNPEQQAQILKDGGVPASVGYGGTLDSLAGQLHDGRSVILEVNSNTLWDQEDIYDEGGADHAVVATSVLRDPDTGKISGFTVNDSGDGQGNKFIDPAKMEKMWVNTKGPFGPGCYVVTDGPRQYAQSAPKV